MKRLSLTVAFCAVLLLVPAYALAQDAETAEHDAVHERLEAQHDSVHESLRERNAVLLERLRNADLRPAEKRRIYNSLIDDLRDQHGDAHERLRRIHRRAHDRPTDIRPDARPVGRPTVREVTVQTGRPGTLRPGGPERPPVQGQRGLRVARLATRR